MPTADQERVIGRRQDNGAPLTGGDERSAADFGARTADGSLVIPANAHMRLAAPAANEGAAMLRRGFSYVDGDESGLLFLAWQADPRRGFIPVQHRLVAGDALSRFIRHETSALFAVPGGVAPRLIPRPGPAGGVVTAQASRDALAAACLVGLSGCSIWGPEGGPGGAGIATGDEPAGQRRARLSDRMAYSGST